MNTPENAGEQVPTGQTSGEGTGLYDSGWAYAVWHINKGGDLDADAPEDWPDEKVHGFWDRLAAERRKLAEKPEGMSSTT